jgi:type I restriction enzyme, S subunit
MPIVKLGEICEINPSTPHTFDPDDACSFVPMEAVDDVDARIVRIRTRPFREVAKGYTPFAENDVIVAKITPCMENGKCAIGRRLRSGVAFGSTEFHVLRATKRVIPEWLFYFWRFAPTRKLASVNMTGSAGQKRVPASFLETADIPLPDLSEQRYMARQLEDADRLRRTRRYALELTDTFLTAAFLELFGDPVANPRGWERARVCELGDVETGNTPPRETTAYYGSAIEWIKSDNISLAQMHPSNATERLSEKGIEVGRTVETGSLLLTCIAGSETSIGNVVLTDRRVAFNQQINAVTPHRDVDPQFLYGLFLAVKPMIQRNTTLAMKRMITKGKLENLVLIKPPLPLQRKFAALVERVERLRAVHREASRQAEHVFASLLHHAFTD